MSAIPSDSPLDGLQAIDCPPAHTMRRRGWLAATLAGALGAGSSQPAAAAPVGPGAGSITIGKSRLQIVDLTHELTKDFNWVPTKPRVLMDPIIGSGLASGMQLHRMMLNEHTGTHIDAPNHFSNDGKSLGEIPITDLIVPLAVMDLRKRFESDPNAGLSVQDVLDWERQHGRLPDGCCVVINSGYDPLVRNRPTLRRESPGFSPEVARFLLDQRNVKGIGVDAMSIDQGTNGPAYPVHQLWLRAGRWALEGLTNLDAVPAAGAVLFIGAAPIKEATGMPIRAVAIF